MTSTMSNMPFLMQTYNRLPVNFSHGEGCWLYDSAGKKYLDGLCGISVTNLGHNHPAVTRAIAEQSAKLLHTSNLYQIEAQQALAEKLCKLSGMEAVFFGNSGAEANEAAIKIAKLYGHHHNIDEPLILTFSGSFHGRTLGTIAATANDKIKAGFGPLTPGFKHLPFNDISAVQQAFVEHDNIVAVLVEPVQGEGGIHLANEEFLIALQVLCQQNEALFMLDEIQSGNARCGRYFAHQLIDALQPDVVTLAKALGNGIPIGACIARGEAAKTFAPGNHGSTFGGNPFACRVAHTVVEEIEQASLCSRAEHLSNVMGQQLNSALANFAALKEIRRCGLMIGIDLDIDLSNAMAKALDMGLVINVTAGSVIRLLPPLIMSDSEAEQLIDGVATLIKKL